MSAAARKPVRSTRSEYAYKLMEGWAADHDDQPSTYARRAEQRQSFNDRFWYAEGGYLLT